MPFIPPTRHWLKQKGFLFLINLVLAIFFVWLVFPFFKYRSANPTIFGRYSLRFVICLFAISAGISVYAYLAAIGSKRLNRILFLVVVGVFAVGEISVRALVKSPLLPHRQLAEPKPYVEFAHQPRTTFAAYELMFVAPEKAPNGQETTNDIAFRGAVPPLPKRNEYRIIVLGGSAAFAGFPLSNSIAGQLQSLFQQDGQSQVKVYNWGVQGYISGQELSLLSRTVLDYDPDLVIVYDGANDIYLPYFSDPRPDYPYLFMEQEARVKDVVNGPTGLPPAAYILRKSKFLMWGLSLVPNSRVDPPRDLSRLNELKQQTAYGSAAWENAVAASYVTNHRRMCVIARGGHFKIVTVLQPTLAFKHQLVGNEQSIWNPAPEFLQYCRDRYQKMWQGLIDSATDSSTCYTLDLHDTFANDDKEVFVDSLHITNEGNGEIARRIFEAIKKADVVASPASGN